MVLTGWFFRRPTRMRQLVVGLLAAFLFILIAADLFRADSLVNTISHSLLRRSSRLRNNVTLPCPLRPPGLVGRVKVNFEAPSYEEIAQINHQVQNGGQFRPSGCKPLRDRLAVVIPYRNRDRQLRALINHLHPILQRQQLDYQIFVVEQAGNGIFNKAILMNAAFVVSQKMSIDPNDTDSQFQCYIFHDVDLFVEDDRAIYKCGERPIHLSEYLDKFNYESYKYTEDVLYGGVVSISRRLFELANGYSNLFYGWGAEDEEMRIRLRVLKMDIEKPDKEYYRYKMLRHGRDPLNPWNPKNEEMLETTSERMPTDGLTSLNYQLLQVDELSTHTRLLIDFQKVESIPQPSVKTS